MGKVDESLNDELRWTIKLWDTIWYLWGKYFFLTWFTINEIARYQIFRPAAPRFCWDQIGGSICILQEAPLYGKQDMDVGQNGRPRGPQMWMSSLVLTIQLLGYLILTHSHMKQQCHLIILRTSLLMHLARWILKRYVKIHLARVNQRAFGFGHQESWNMWVFLKMDPNIIQFFVMLDIETNGWSSAVRGFMTSKPSAMYSLRKKGDFMVERAMYFFNVFYPLVI